MKQLLMCLVLAGSLAGCAGTIPSTYDPNESQGIINILHTVEKLDCKDTEYAEYSSGEIKEMIQWLHLYSEMKGNEDILLSIHTIQVTASGLKKGMSTGFCKIKKQLLITQIESTAQAIMSRYGE